MNRGILFAVVAALVFAMFTPPAAAEVSWDLIYTDQLDATLCDGCFITLAGVDFALLVNTGTDDIVGSQFFGASFEVTSSAPEIRLSPFVNDPGTLLMPIHPHEALGSVRSLANDVIGSNDVLLMLLAPGETHYNPGLQVLGFTLARTETSSATFEGPVHFDVKMTMGGRFAQFRIDAQMHLGDARLLFPGAARVSSVPIETPANHFTWGRLKSMYH